MTKILQIRISNFDGTNSVILERATNRKYAEIINSADEGISFSIAKSDPKADVLNPDIDGYIKRWEVWETSTNKLLNFGPITSISDSGNNWDVQGAGRTALLADFYSTTKTFYASIYDVFEEATYENIAAQPRASTLVPSTTTSAAQTTVFGNTVVIDERYHGLSERTKDNTIDDDIGRFVPGKLEPPNTYYSNNTFWSGMSKADSHIVDLGAVYDLNKIMIYFPAWGGPQKFSNRAYDYEVAVATDEGSTTSLQGKEFGTFTTIYTSDVPNMNQSTFIRYIGLNGATITTDTTLLNLPPVPVRYIRTKIKGVRAWFGTVFDNEASTDAWDYQCNPDYVTGSNPNIGASLKAAMTDDINDRVLEPANDCHASITEVRALKQIVNIEDIKELALQRIDNNSLQITYSYNPVAGKTVTTSSGYRKFEPGSFFRKATISWSGASTTYYKFYDSDCSNCYPDGFNFGVLDQNNSMVYSSDSSSGNTTRSLPASTKHIIMKGASDATVTWCDAWPANVDPLSWGGTYSYNEIAGDTAIIHFRGQSFKWYATVPTGKTGAQVSVQIRSNTGSGWSSYSTLSTFTLPSDINGEVVYQIPFESGVLAADTTYEIKITNVDGNYCSIDSIEGYWEGSLTEYNEDNSRIFISKPYDTKQIYDARFSGGSMYKGWGNVFFTFSFTGDRVILLSAKGRHHGKMRLLLLDKSIGSIYDPGTSNHVFIPGGNSDGSLSIDLDTGKRGNEITQYIAFDSNDYFPSGLPWKAYSLSAYLYAPEKEYYTSPTADIEFDSFVPRCKDCTTPTGTDVTIQKPIFIDSFIAHERVGLSLDFNNETQLDQIKSVAEAIQVEWKVDADGLLITPRLGTDTNIMLREGENTLVDWNIVNDVSQVASILLSNGSDIDGLPLFTITENKKTRERLGRTIMRQQDFRSIGSYFDLVGVSRTELEKRKYPPKRITVTHIGNNLGLRKGDSFILWTKKSGQIRVRIIRNEIDESSGRVYNLECVTWPQIA